MGGGFPLPHTERLMYHEQNGRSSSKSQSYAQFAHVSTTASIKSNGHRICEFDDTKHTHACARAHTHTHTHIRRIKAHYSIHKGAFHVSALHVGTVSLHCSELQIQ